jgi:lipopolysaccharide assembly outer membrane protein LptD (OstA)
VYGDNSFRTLKVGSSVRDDTGNAAKINYTYKDEDFARVASDYIKLQLVTPILKPLYIKFEERYDFRESRELEKVVGFGYRSKCWGVLLTYRDRYREFDDNDKEIMFTFVLAGLGQDKSFNKRFHKDLDNDFDDARGEMLE